MAAAAAAVAEAFRGGFFDGGQAPARLLPRTCRKGGKMGMTLNSPVQGRFAPTISWEDFEGNSGYSQLNIGILSVFR